MSEPRRIVPDASVVLPMFLPEQLVVGGHSFDLSLRTIPLAEAIRGKMVAAIAPELLRFEFIKVVAEHTWPRTGPAQIDPDDADGLLSDFFDLPIGYISDHALAPIAWKLIKEQRISPSDCWYVACAIHHDAELWISHEHADGLVAKARAVHDQVFVLTESRFA